MNRSIQIAAKCARCVTGATVSARDYYGDYITCLSCGHVTYPKPPKMKFGVPRGKERPGRKPKSGPRRRTVRRSTTR